MDNIHDLSFKIVFLKKVCSCNMGVNCYSFVVIKSYFVFSLQCTMQMWYLNQTSSTDQKDNIANIESYSFDICIKKITKSSSRHDQTGKN